MDLKSINISENVSIFCWQGVAAIPYLPIGGIDMFVSRCLNLSIIFTIFVSMLFVGCGTDAKPNYFINMFKDSSDIDGLSECLTSVPEIDEDGNIIIKVSSECLTTLSNRKSIIADTPAIFEEILKDPETYMDKLLVFEAVVKKIHGSDNPELYTNKMNREFHITTHGAGIYWLDENDEKQPVYPNQSYTFTCRIYEIKIYTTGLWKIQAESPITIDKKLVFPPTPISDELQNTN